MKELREEKAAEVDTLSTKPKPTTKDPEKPTEAEETETVKVQCFKDVLSMFDMSTQAPLQISVS